MVKKVVVPNPQGELLMLAIARDIAMDVYELDKILENHGIKHQEFYRIERHPQFQRFLQQEIQNWNSALNTAERIKLKSAAMIEQWLPEAFTQLHNSDAPLLHRTDLAKTVARLGGMDKGQVNTEGGGERFSITINLGNDQKLNFNKEQLPQKVIEHEDVDS